MIIIMAEFFIFPYSSICSLILRICFVDKSFPQDPCSESAHERADPPSTSIVFRDWGFATDSIINHGFLKRKWLRLRLLEAVSDCLTATRDGKF